MKKFGLEAPLIAASGQEWKLSDDGVTDEKGNYVNVRKAMLPEIVQMLINALPSVHVPNPLCPCPIITMADAVSSMRVLTACRDANGTLDLEDADYDWLKVKVDEHAPHVYGINAAVLKEALGSTESRAVRRAKARKG